jgi:hypothetical protein
MDTLTAFFDTDEIPYSVTSVVTGTTHSFESFEDVVREVDAARIYGGMHYLYSVKQGNRLGRRVADYVLKNKFRSIGACRKGTKTEGDDDEKPHICHGDAQ